MGVIPEMFIKKFPGAFLRPANYRGKIFFDGFWFKGGIGEPGILAFKLFRGFAAYDKAVFFEEPVKFRETPPRFDQPPGRQNRSGW
jgi:hypothetical protein